MSDSKKQPSAPTTPELPKGARLTRHGNVIQDGTVKVPEDNS